MEIPEIQILATRQIDEELVRTAAAYSIFITEIPFIETELHPVTLFDEQLKSSTARDLVLTSVNAVLSIARIDAVRQTPWRVWCIGHATRTAAELNLPQSFIAGAAPDGEQLAAAIIAGDVKTALFCCGDRRRDVIPDKLKGAGIAVEELEVYRTKLVPQRIERHFDGILFFSPSAVESYLTENIPPAGAVLFAIGNTTGAALSALPNKLLISESPDTRILIKQLIEHYRQR